MRRSQRLIAAAVLIALSSALAGCSGGFGNWDPTDVFDWLDTKKKLPGDRKPVFPDGVPGLEQGVPKELYKSEVEKEQQQEAAQAAAAAAAPPAADQPPAAEQPAPKSKQAKAKKGRQPATASSAPAADSAGAEPDGEARSADGTAAAPEPPRHKKLVHHKRITTPASDSAAVQSGQAADAAPPAQSSQSAQSAQQSSQPFPAPLPSGSFTR